MSQEQFAQLVAMLTTIITNQESLEEDIRILSEKVEEMDTSYGDGFSIDRLDN